MAYALRHLAITRPGDLTAEVAGIEPDQADASALLGQAAQHLIRAEGLSAEDARVLRQTLTALGGAALISAAALHGMSPTTSGLLSASSAQLDQLIARLRALGQPSLDALAQELQACLHGGADAPPPALDVGGARFVWGARTYLMGIINVTPDSFSADGLARPGTNLAVTALLRARRYVEEGADLLDIGGESTRPGAAPIRLDEELGRVLPAITAIARGVALPISVDTHHAEVAEAALDAGAHIVNDIWGLRTPDGGWNTPLAELVARRGVPIMLMHNRRAQPVVGALGGHYPSAQYQHLISEVLAGLRESVAFATAHGIPRERIIVDPGLGFGKTPDQNLTIMRRLSEFRSLGLPLLIGASRKSFIGLPLNLPPEERDEGTAAVTALAVQAGADIVRVHNMRMNLRAARIIDAIVRDH